LTLVQGVMNKCTDISFCVITGASRAYPNTV